MLLITVHLYAYPGQTAALHDFERQAIPVVQQYGGKLLAAFKPANPNNSTNIPDEIHWLQFPSQAAFDAYRQAPETAALADQHKLTIRKNEIFFSQEIVDYPA